MGGGSYGCARSATCCLEQNPHVFFQCVWIPWAKSGSISARGNRLDQSSVGCRTQVLAGSPEFRVTGGSAVFRGHDLLALKPEERARLGLFLRCPAGLCPCVLTAAAVYMRGSVPEGRFAPLQCVATSLHLVQLRPAL